MTHSAGGSGPQSGPDSAPRSGFDKLALPYRWMEYLTFGPLLSRTRRAFLPQLKQARSALLLGDGDGRFTAALLRANPHVHATAVDISAAMLHRLRNRVAQQGNADRLATLHANALSALLDGPFDLVCTHFFLDCLSDAECSTLAHQLADRLAPSALWVVSDFAIPPGSLHGIARLLVGALYAAFGLLTGLRVRTLPDYAAALQSAGLRRIALQTRLRGILRSELWQLSADADPANGHPIAHE
ncbi:class I SAM-dependent methyltransferase [Terriglobus aquaticus]|uniref:Class I SAM-dependent methyltransferase n=1 Tax=Terriglobus aquaticus TaxID=940139 RepID=A0ABW9KJ80_9BACT|nr:class I SAM-dependent methyltransferase [Terriglobus aquaticus]